MQEVKPNTLWKHTNGNKYKVLVLTNQKSERHEQYPITVVYQNYETKSLWSRPLSDWHRSMTFHGWDYEYNNLIIMDPTDSKL